MICYGKSQENKYIDLILFPPDVLVGFFTVQPKVWSDGSLLKYPYSSAFFYRNTVRKGGRWMVECKWKISSTGVSLGPLESGSDCMEKGTEVQCRSLGLTLAIWKFLVWINKQWYQGRLMRFLYYLPYIWCRSGMAWLRLQRGD